MSASWPRILMYHSVRNLDYDPNMLCTSPERFRAQISYLRKRNLRGVSIRDLRRAMSAGNAKGLVGLTFDDGYEDFLHTVVPVLEEFGFSATVFAVVGMLERENDWQHAYNPRPRMRLLGAAGLREVAARGMEVGSHSMTHPDLAGLDPGMLDEEVDGSRQMLGEVLGEEVQGFCYPYGSLDRAAVEAVRRAGYAYASAWRMHVEHSAYDLPRMPMSQRDNLLRFATKLKVYPQYSRVAHYWNRPGSGGNTGSSEIPLGTEKEKVRPSPR